MAKSWGKHNRAGYRSGFEHRVSKFFKESGIGYEYETHKINYVIPSSDHVYTPDFVLVKADGSLMYIETKGRWEGDDRKKHFLIKEQHPDLDLRFVFQNPRAKIRKGSKTTYADICEGKLRGKKNFVVPYAKAGKEGEIPEEWLRELKDWSE